MLEAQIKTFKYSIVYILLIFILMLVALIGFGLLLGDEFYLELRNEFTSAIELWSYVMLIPVWIFVYVELYSFKNYARKLFLPLLLITELLVFVFEPTLLSQEDATDYYSDAIFDFIDYSVFFLDGLIFALMYLTDMKKEFK